MSTKLLRDGYPQVEPNHLSAPRDGGVNAQWEAASTLTELSQGMFLKYDAANAKVNVPGSLTGPFYMVYNEEKLYDENKQMHKDYIMKAADAYDGKMYPRLFRLTAGDIWTTNNLYTASTTAAASATAYAKGDKLTIDTTTGVLKAASTSSQTPDPVHAEVIAETTMPDGQPGFKLRWIA